MDWLDIDLGNLAQVVRGAQLCPPDAPRNPAGIREGSLHWLHLSLDSRTFSLNAEDTHGETSSHIRNPRVYRTHVLGYRW